MSQVTTEFTVIQQPDLKEGETYVGAIFGPDGRGHHVILLPETKDSVEWDDAMKWAQSVGGDLPSRLELSLIYVHARDQFAKSYYWSNEKEGSAYAWYQDFSYGYQYSSTRSLSLRARAVRRLSI